MIIIIIIIIVADRASHEDVVSCIIPCSALWHTFSPTVVIPEMGLYTFWVKRGGLMNL